MLPRSIRGLVPAAALLLAVGGCDRAPSPTGAQGRSGEPIQVYLPPTPDLTRPRPPIRHPDGAYTVRGVVMGAAKLVNRPVKVRGLVSSVERCAEEEERYCALPSHGVLVDDLAEPTHRLTFVGERIKLMEGLEHGARVDMEGRVDTVSTDGRLVSLEGLLVLAPPTRAELDAGKENAEAPRRTRRARGHTRRAPQKIDLSLP